MKILVDCSTARMGGARTYLEEFLRASGGLRDHVSWIVYGPPGCRFSLAQHSSAVDLRELPRLFSTSLAYFCWLQKILPEVAAQERVDAVFASTGFGMLAPSRPQLLLVRNPIYFSPLYIRKVRDLRVRFQVWARRRLSLKMIQRSDAVLFPTQAMRDLVESHLSLDGLRSLVVPYGCDVEAFRQRAKDIAWLPESIRRERRRFLLNVSHYCAQKNFTVLFRALALLRRKGFLRPLVLTARLKRAPNCNFREDQAIIAQEHLEGQVVQLGAIAREHIPTLYQMAGLFVFPSYVESFGHPLVEAMAAGLPIVAADTPVNREICGPAAVYAGPFDAEDWAAQIKKLAETPGRCEQLREACQARVSRFSWRAHVEAVLNASEEILKQKGRIP